MNQDRRERWKPVWRVWPPRLPDQPIFFPVLNRWYATKIAREWNVTAEGVGYVTRWSIDFPLGFIQEESAIFGEVHRATLTNREPNQLQIPANVST